MTAPAPFSVVVLEGDHNSLPLPELGPYFVATKTGYFVHRTFHFGRALHRTKDAVLTPELAPTVWLTIAPLPAELIGQAYSFFRAIYLAKHSEAMVLIVHSPEQGYRLFVPPQQAHGSGVKAIRTPEHVRGQVVGSIHSHCNFSAFHSGTDKHDAGANDGLHITIGDVMKDTPSIAAMMSVAGDNYDLEPSEYTDGPLAIHQHPTWWERYVTQPANNSGLYDGAFGGSTWKPQGAPNKNTPTVVASTTRPVGGMVDKKAMSIEEVLWAYSDLFNDEETGEVETAANFLHTATTILERVGIEVDMTFNVLNIPTTMWTDDEDAFNDRRTTP